MSILSNSVFITAQSLNSDDLKIKRSHLFELYASYMGFKSYSSLNVESFIDALNAVRSDDYHVIYQRLARRLEELNYPVELTDNIANSIKEQLQLIFQNSDYQVFLDTSNYLLSSKKSTGFNSCNVKEINQKLEALVEKRNTTACLLSLVWRYLELHADDMWSCLPLTVEQREILLYDFSNPIFKQVYSDGKRILSSFNHTNSIDHEVNASYDFNPHPLKGFLSVTDIPHPNIIDVIDGVSFKNFCCFLNTKYIMGILDHIYSREFSEPNRIRDEWIILSIIQSPNYKMLEYLYYWMYGSTVKRYAIYLFGLKNNIDISLINGRDLEYNPAARKSTYTRSFFDPEFDHGSEQDDVDSYDFNGAKYDINTFEIENPFVEQCSFFELTFRENQFKNPSVFHEFDYSLLNSSKDKNNCVFLSLPVLSEQELIESKRIVKELRKIQLCYSN